MPTLTPLKTRRVRLGNGEPAIYNAANLMVGMIRSSSGTWPVRYYATKIIGPTRPRSWKRELEAVRVFLRRNTRFLPDPDQLEFLQHPETVLNHISTGEIAYLDCDDYSMLVASLLRSVGYPVKLRVVALQKDHGQLGHVFVMVWTGREWIPFDGTRADLFLGWTPQHTRAVEFGV